MKILFTAAEIAQMRLPGLPTTKASILSRASKEGWFYEEQYGIGGVRKVFEVPESYLPKEKISRASIVSAREDVEKYFIAHSDEEGERGADIDEASLVVAARVLEEWLAHKLVVINPKRKATLIAVLYKIIVNGADPKDLVRLLDIVTDGGMIDRTPPDDV